MIPFLIPLLGQMEHLERPPAIVTYVFQGDPKQGLAGFQVKMDTTWRPWLTATPFGTRQFYVKDNLFLGPNDWRMTIKRFDNPGEDAIKFLGESLSKREEDGKSRYRIVAKKGRLGGMFVMYLPSKKQFLITYQSSDKKDMFEAVVQMRGNPKDSELDVFQGIFSTLEPAPLP